MACDWATLDSMKVPRFGLYVRSGLPLPLRYSDDPALL